ncbi:LSM7-like [Zea mays]|uniref:LSM7-like n=1 Tax=Zea mays TaxID=4577 RepID=A0A1D6JFB0_MAIZE|nr:LSM7-like [Zea mays]
MYGQGPALFLGEFFPLPPLRPCRAAAAASTVRAKIRSSLSAIFGRRRQQDLREGFRVEMAGRKETALDLAKFVDKGVQVKLTGGRQVTGTLKGYDQLLNLVLDEAVENERGKTRQLGLIVCRGTAVMLVSPTDGTDEIANPFLADGA